MDKLTAISLSFIRDYLQLVDFSLLDAYRNIADDGSRVGGNVFLFHWVVRTRRFVISFAGSRKIKEWKDDGGEVTNETARESIFINFGLNIYLSG